MCREACYIRAPHKFRPLPGKGFDLACRFSFDPLNGLVCSTNDQTVVSRITELSTESRWLIAGVQHAPRLSPFYSTGFGDSRVLAHTALDIL